MAEYILRDIDDRTWARAKARAQADGDIPMKTVLLKLLDLYVRGEIVIQAARNPRS